MLWPFAGSGQAFRGAGTTWTFLFLLFFVGFAIAWMLDVSPSEATAWLDAHSAIWEWIGGWLWRLFWGIVVLVCAILIFGIGVEWFGKKAPGLEHEPRNVKGGCCMLVAIVVTVYIAWIAITLPLV